jgi:putative ABC transport system permease protein
MLKNNLLLAIRQLRKNPATAALNFFGLSIGLAVAFVIGLHVRREWATDGFVPEKDRVFRAIRISGVEGKPYEIGITSPNYLPALVADFPGEIEAATRFYPDHIFIQVNGQGFQERKFAYADANFFEFFGLKLLLGDPATALREPHSVVLTEKTAQKLFGSPAAAMGKTLRWNQERDILVTGVIGLLPAGSHLEFDYLAALDVFKNEGWFREWWNNNLCTYLRLAPGTSAASIDGRLNGFMDKYFAADFARQGGRIDLRLQPLADVYWNAETRYDPVRHGNRAATDIFAIAALLLVVIACFNFINLATARATERGKEVGVRKTLGAGRVALGRQFLLESFLMTSAATLTAFLLTKLALPFFNRYLDLDLSLSELPDFEIAVWLAGIAVLVGFGAGFYPAALLSGFRPVAVLKSKARLGGGAVGLRRGLTVAQFGLSIVLIVSTLVVSKQLSFLKNKNLGFDRENVITLETYGTEVRREKLNTFRQRLEKMAAVRGVSCSDAAPGNSPDASIIEMPGRSDRPKINVLYADFQFASTLGLPLVAGRDFDPNLKTDTAQAVLLNESACRTLGLTPEQAIGQVLTPVYFDTLRHRAVGVLKDYHFLSLREKIDPLIVIPNYRYPGTLAIRVAAGNLPTAIEQIRSEWQALDPAHPFEYRMLDERLARLYESEARQGKLFGLFAGVAIFIACLGMFGLATLLAGQRMKEIGIRKVLGASVAGITGLLVRDFVKLVVIAIVIASPLAFYFMQKWLSDFAYRIDIQWWMFAGAGVLAVAIAFLTVGFQSVRAALANPVKSLRSE